MNSDWKVNRFQVFSMVAAADRKWSFGPVSGMSNGQNQLGHSQSPSIEQTRSPRKKLWWETTSGLRPPSLKTAEIDKLGVYRIVPGEEQAKTTRYFGTRPVHDDETKKGSTYRPLLYRPVLPNGPVIISRLYYVHKHRSMYNGGVWFQVWRGWK